MNSTFDFEPATFVPFRDKAAVAKARAIKRADIARHPNPEYRIEVQDGAGLEDRWIADIVGRIKRTAESGSKLVMLMPNPWPNYVKVAGILNRERIPCHHVVTFNLDEYADQDGRIAPPSWEFGFGHAFRKFFIEKIDPALRPPEKQIHLLGDDTLADYEFGTDMTVVALGKYVAGGGTALTSFGQDGKKLGTVTLTETPAALSSQSRKLLVLTSDGVTVYDSALRAQKSAAITTGYLSAVLLPDGDALLLSTHYAEKCTPKAN